MARLNKNNQLFILVFEICPACMSMKMEICGANNIVQLVIHCIIRLYKLANEALCICTMNAIWAISMLFTEGNLLVQHKIEVLTSGIMLLVPL